MNIFYGQTRLEHIKRPTFDTQFEMQIFYDIACSKTVRSTKRLFTRSFRAVHIIQYDSPQYLYTVQNEIVNQFHKWLPDIDMQKITGNKPYTISARPYILYVSIVKMAHIGLLLD